jgi:hypothetical protein
MVQGVENDLLNISYYTNTSEIYFVEDNRPVVDLNKNILTVDNKAILAKTTAVQAQTDFAAHQGGGGSGVHGLATPSVAGFMSAADKIKIDGIQAGASVNIISPTDALELVGKGITTLHRHPVVDTARKGFMSFVDKVKMNGIELLADVNNISDIDATTLVGGPSSNATLLHTHVQPSFTETFTQAVHFTHDHTGLPGITPYTGINTSLFNISNEITTTGPLVTEVYSQPFGFQISAMCCGIHTFGTVGAGGGYKLFQIENVQVTAGNVGVVTFSIQETIPTGGSCKLRVWLAAGGL